MLLRVLEIAVLVFLFLSVITQIIIPLLTGRPLFPVFTSERSTVEDQIDQAKENASVGELKKQLDQITKTPETNTDGRV
jgi:hypothetical protein